MKIQPVKLVVITVFLFMCGDLLPVANAGPKWLSGRVESTSLSGHGPETDSKTHTVRRKDAWWNYSVSTHDRCYSLSSRDSPTKIGMTKNSEIKFYTRRNQFYVLDPNGKRVALRILRTVKSNTCP